MGPAPKRPSLGRQGAVGRACSLLRPSCIHASGSIQQGGAGAPVVEAVAVEEGGPTLQSPPYTDMTASPHRVGAGRAGGAPVVGSQVRPARDTTGGTTATCGANMRRIIVIIALYMGIRYMCMGIVDADGRATGHLRPLPNEALVVSSAASAALAIQLCVRAAPPLGGSQGGSPVGYSITLSLCGWWSRFGGPTSLARSRSSEGLRERVGPSVWQGGIVVGDRQKEGG